MGISILWNYWLISAFIAPILWALVNVIDVYFVGEVYDDELDGTAVMGLFQIAPLLALFFVPLSFPNLNVTLLGLLAGALFLISFYFYFKALFTTNDVTIIGILWNITILLLPIIAYFVVGEKLTLIQYAGLVVAFIGALLISADEKIKERNLKKVVLIMMGAVSFLSVSMAISDKVYKEAGFFNGFMIFSVGAFIAGIFFAVARLKFHRNNTRIKLLKLKKKHYFGFFAAEFFTLIGTIFSQRTIDLSPAVSFVAAIESMQAFFILLISAIIFIVLSLRKNKDKEVVKLIYKDQLVGYKIKILASIIIAIGIYMLNV